MCPCSRKRGSSAAWRFCATRGEWSGVSSFGPISPELPSSSSEESEVCSSRLDPRQRQAHRRNVFGRRTALLFNVSSHGCCTYIYPIDELVLTLKKKKRQRPRSNMTALLTCRLAPKEDGEGSAMVEACIPLLQGGTLAP